MNSIRCSKCGFTGWATAGNCKKCHAPLERNAPPAGGFRPAAAQKPSAVQILKNDRLSAFAVMMPLVLWAIYIAVTFFGVSLTSRRSGTVVENSDGDLLYLIPAIALTVLGAALIVWRLNSISKVFETGESVMGVITDVSFFKDRGRIEFSYHYGRQNLQGASAIMKNAKTTAYRHGDEVALIVDSANPARAFIRDLYV